MLLVNFSVHLLFLQICSRVALDWLLRCLMVCCSLPSWRHHQQVPLFFKLIQLRRCFVAGEIVSFPTCMFLYIFTSLRILSFPGWFEMRWRRVRFHLFILRALLLCWPAFVLFLAENILSFIIFKFLIISTFSHVIWLLILKIVARRASLPIWYILSSTIRIDSILSCELALFADKRWFILHPEFQIINFGGIPSAWLKCQIGDDWTVYAHATIVLCIQI